QEIHSGQPNANGFDIWFLCDAVYANGMFTGVGNGAPNLIMRSSEGIARQFVKTPTQSYCNSIGFGLGTYVIAGGGILGSSDGLNWRDEGRGPWGTSLDFHEVRFGGGWFVMGGNAGTVLQSSDGQDWTVAWDQADETIFTGVAFGDRTRVCVGNDLDEVTTLLEAGTDMKWVARDISGLIPPPPPQRLVPALNDVAYGNGLYAAVGDYHLILLGSEPPAPPTLSALKVGSSGTCQFLVSGLSERADYRIDVSEDLKHWTALTNVVGTPEILRISDS